MSISLSGIWSVASETYMSMVAWNSDLYRYFEVCYPINHVGYASLSPESINIITVTWNPFTILHWKPSLFSPLVDTTFFPLTLLMNRDAMFISCRGRGRSRRKRGQLYILSTTQSMISGKLCYLLTNKPFSRVSDSERYSNKETIQNKNKTKTKTKTHN